MVIPRREPGPRDVEIAITHCGLCHSDIDRARELWGSTRFPIVPGHEIIGTVVATGSDVSTHAVGDRVAVGCMVDSCGECIRCVEGLEQYCLRGNVQTYNWIGRDGQVTQGGYSDRVVVDEHFVLRVPASLSSAGAAPLLCAGVTMYSPLRHWNVGPTTRLGIIGLGGLGHVGVQIGAALGAEVTVLDLDESKREDAIRLGATDFRVATDPDAFTDLAESLDLIVSTVPANLDYGAYLSLLTLDGTFVNVGVPSRPIEVAAFALISHRRSIAGTRTGSIRETQEVLDFCADHGIEAEVELVDATAIDESFDRMLAGDVRYRFVLETDTLTAPHGGARA
ncbi:NAD(P)-dependent alcohol dehydrogenase [Microbacterium sp. X-17]|uniref:NAD(P)-dependent alcohol dehydrogenase n=1 Tax=Microbacterium sp. X-17 TaxID=3144404 RepID=UPI0031F5888C